MAALGSDYFDNIGGLHWVIDVLGSVGNLSYCISAFAGDPLGGLDKDECLKYVSSSGMGGLQTDDGGVYYVSREVHWRSIWKGMAYDSWYNNGENHQMHSHLCQSFAVYGFLRLVLGCWVCGDLVAGEYVDNSKKVATMLWMVWGGHDIDRSGDFNANNGSEDARYYQSLVGGMAGDGIVCGSYSAFMEEINKVKVLGIE